MKQIKEKIRPIIILLGIIVLSLYYLVLFYGGSIYGIFAAIRFINNNTIDETFLVLSLVCILSSIILGFYFIWKLIDKITLRKYKKKLLALEERKIILNTVKLLIASVVIIIVFLLALICISYKVLLLKILTSIAWIVICSLQIIIITIGLILWWYCIKKY